jgi:hypothetical protein
MKQIGDLTIHSLMTVCALLAATTLRLQASDLAIATFNDSSSIPPNWDVIWGAPATASWDSSQNVAPPPGGSMHVQANWDITVPVYSWQDVKVSFDQVPSVDASLYSQLEADIKVDPGVNGMYGGWQLVCQTWSDPDHVWGVLDMGYFANTSDWQHLTGSLSSFPAHIDRIVLNLFFYDPYGVVTPQGPTDYWIDNVELTAVPEPSALTLLGAGTALLIWKRRSAV